MAEALRKVRMAACPMNYPFQKRGAEFFTPPESLCEGSSLGFGEVAELDALAYVERRGADIPYQIRWRGNTQETEGQPLERRVLASAGIELS